MKILKFTLLTALAAATALTTMAKAKRQAGGTGRGSMSGYDDGMEDSLGSGADMSSGESSRTSSGSSRMSPGTSSNMSPGTSSAPGSAGGSAPGVTVSNTGIQPGSASSPVIAGVGAEEGEPATADITETSSVDEPRPGLRSVGSSGDTGSRQP